MRVTAAGSLPADDFRGALVAMTEALPTNFHGDPDHRG